MAKYSVGQKVVIVDDGTIHTTYYDWVSDNKLRLSDDKLRRLWVKYLSSDCNNNSKNGTELTVIASGRHRNFEQRVMYLCEDSNGNPVLISEAGLEPVEEGLKWTDLKIGDILKNKIYGFLSMVIGIDPSESVSTHINVGDSWRTDGELRDNWEKVEE